MATVPEDRTWVLEEAALGIVEAVAYRTLCSVRCPFCGEPTRNVSEERQGALPDAPGAILEHRTDCPIGLLMVGCDWETRDVEHHILPQALAIR